MHPDLDPGYFFEIYYFFLAKIVYPHILEDPDPGSQNLADPTDWDPKAD